MSNIEISDLVTDPPKDAVICPQCGGFGVLPHWVPGPMMSSKDCLECDCNGWVMPEEVPF